MRVSTSSGEYFVEWEYGNKKCVRSNEEFISRFTRCLLYSGSKKDGEERALKSQGLCLTSSKDMFCKNVGRKISLARALVAIKDRRDRALFWNAYFNMRNGKH